jgi:RNA methyltransferase, TrmH family
MIELAMRSASQDRVRRVSSRQNTLVKDLRRAFSQGELVDGLCAIEGMRIIEEAIRSGLKFRAVFFADSAEQRMERLLPQISSHAEVLALPNEVFESAISTETPQGVAALVHWPKFGMENVFGASEPFLLGAMGIQDPGNLGTIIRSAEAFGAAGVVLGEKTVSQFNSKVVRASAGSSFRLPTFSVSLKDVQELKKPGLRVLAASSHKGEQIDRVDLKGGVLVMIGSEGDGVPREFMAFADDFIRVPHEERVESLNAAVAASVILYEAQRQRRIL